MLPSRLADSLSTTRFTLTTPPNAAIGSPHHDSTSASGSVFAAAQAVDVRPVPGGYLVQDADTVRAARSAFKVVTKAKPTQDQIESLVLADAIAKHVKSNAIVLVRGKKLVGCGAGQMSRFDSSVIAARKAGKRAKGSVLASDAMFPAADGLEAAADTGAVAIIQPGGSVRDDEVIAAADKRGIPMIFTGMRHFLH